MPRSNACVAWVQSESGTPPAIGALTGIRVVDFSTRLPGPLGTLILAEAGAEVIKIERPDTGDDTRAHKPALAGDGATFALLNRGKRSVAIDLKDADATARLAPLIASADVVVEQFRPGVMDRLGFGYDQQYVSAAGGKWPGLERADAALREAAQRDGFTIEEERRAQSKLFARAYQKQRAMEKE